MSNTPKIKLPKSLIDWVQYIGKENAGKHQNCSIKDHIASPADHKIK